MKTFKEYLETKQLEENKNSAEEQQRIDFLKEVDNQIVIHHDLLEKLRHA